jgi:uncharacterized membrane protein YeaQ/YmgE (transglycosylase-associated protein family)
MGIIAFIIVGIVAGFIAGKVMRGGGFGLVGNLGLGVVGAFVGGNLLGWIGMNPSSYGLVGSTITAAIGAILVLWIVGLVKGD